MNLEQFPKNEVAKDMMQMVSNNWYQNSYVGKWLFEVMGMEMKEARVLFAELREQIFPETVTWAIEYHEGKYGIISSDTATLEERRRNLGRKQNIKRPMNSARIEELVKNITGKDVEIVENIAPYTFQVKIIIRDTSADVAEEIIKEQINRIKPSHLSYVVITERPLQLNICNAVVFQTAEIMNLRQVI